MSYPAMTTSGVDVIVTTFGSAAVISTGTADIHAELCKGPAIN